MSYKVTILIADRSAQGNDSIYGGKYLISQ